ncbi:fimbrial assembly protein PilM putative [Vibrio sp. RC586]|uniref:type IV pilus assembly protein PilM n=1 Tax=Vibrio sp. RC586 TaxID=675815 RepID=UPI0001BB7C14|nr:type IV pilus assembly protein PilM [Vibrio sp. RC586]EEZ01026.1 fimbrial assembly protein PilM putative [Vibrio sp. RC586]
MGKSLVTGIDIGHHSIKAVVLKPMGDTYALVGYEELLVTADIFTDNHTLDYQKIVKKLKELKKGLPLFSHKVAVAIPDNAVISKVLQIDSDLEHREQEFAIYQAFSHQSPFPVEELSLDFVKVAEKNLVRTATTTFHVYATKRDVVESRLQASKKAGFEPILMDVQVHSLLHLWQLASRAYRRPDWMLIDVGYTQSSLCLDFTEKMPFYKDVPLGTRALEGDSHGAQAFGQTFAQDPTQRFINEFVDKVARQIQLFTSVHGAQSLSGLWLSGGGATIAGLEEALYQRLSLPCEVLNPFSLFKMNVTKRKRQVIDGQRFSTAAGLALRGLAWLESEHAA